MDQEKKCLYVSSVVGRDIPPEGLQHFLAKTHMFIFNKIGKL